MRLDVESMSHNICDGNLGKSFDRGDKEALDDALGQPLTVAFDISTPNACALQVWSA